MKKKSLVTICCLVTTCYAQARNNPVCDIPAQKSIDLKVFGYTAVLCDRVAEEKSCSIGEGALDEDDLFFDDGDDQESNQPETGQEQTGLLARLQELVNRLGVQAVLGALYISDACSCSYAWLAAYLGALRNNE